MGGLSPAQKRREASIRSRIVAGAYCLVDAHGLIVRATHAGRIGQPVLFWAAGEGSWSRTYDQGPPRLWPTHYAGAPTLAEAS